MKVRKELLIIWNMQESMNIKENYTKQLNIKIYVLVCLFAWFMIILTELLMNTRILQNYMEKLAKFKTSWRH